MPPEQDLNEKKVIPNHNQMEHDVKAEAVVSDDSSKGDHEASASSNDRKKDDHWSLWETLLVCRNIRSARVVAESLNNLKGYHFNFVIIDSCKIPQPFPFSLFSKFSFDFLEILNVTSLQFADNFTDKNRREYFYGRSSKGSSPTSGNTNSRG